MIAENEIFKSDLIPNEKKASIRLNPIDKYWLGSRDRVDCSVVMKATYHFSFTSNASFLLYKKEIKMSVLRSTTIIDFNTKTTSMISQITSFGHNVAFKFDSRKNKRHQIKFEGWMGEAQIICRRILHKKKSPIVYGKDKSHTSKTVFSQSNQKTKNT